MGNCFSNAARDNQKLVQYEQTAVKREQEIRKLKMDKRKLKNLLMCHCKQNDKVYAR